MHKFYLNHPASVRVAQFIHIGDALGVSVFMMIAVLSDFPPDYNMYIYTF